MMITLTFSLIPFLLWSLFFCLTLSKNNATCSRNVFLTSKHIGICHKLSSIPLFAGLIFTVSFSIFVYFVYFILACFLMYSSLIHILIVTWIKFQCCCFFFVFCFFYDLALTFFVLHFFDEMFIDSGFRVSKCYPYIILKNSWAIKLIEFIEFVCLIKIRLLVFFEF